MTGRVPIAVAAVAGLVAFVLTGVGTGPTVAGAAGLLLLLGGLSRGRTGAITLGATGLYAAVLLAGVAGEGAGTLVGASGATVLAWTVGRTGVELRTQGPEMDLQRSPLTHVAGTAMLVAAAAGVAVLPRFLDPRPSPVGLALVCFGAIAITTALVLD